LISLILLGLFPVFVLVILDSASGRKSAIGASYEDTKRLARLAAAKEGALIEGAHQLTVALSVLPAVVEHDQTACNSFVRNLRSAYPQYTNFGVVDVKGSVWCSGSDVTTPVHLGDRPYIRRALDKKEPSLGEYQIGRLTGLPSIVYASPVVHPNGDSGGAAFASLRADAFGVLGRDGDMPQGAVYLVVDHDGRILQRSPEGASTQGQDISELELFRVALHQSSGSVEASGVDGTMRLYGFAWSSADVHRSVLIAIGIPRELAVATADRRMLFSVYTLLIVAVITVVVGAIASQKLIVKPIVQLVSATRRIAAHEPNVRTNMRQRNELGELGRAIDEMARSLDARRVVLEDSEAHFRDLTALSSDWDWEQDEHFRFTDISLEIAAKAGISASEHLGKTRWELPDIKLSQAEWDRHIAVLEAHESFEGFTYQRVGPDGELRYFLISGRPIFDGEGRFSGYRGVGKDVTDAKAAEERIENLAYHDALTGLPNRASFSLLLNHAISRARRAGGGFAILFIDLDGFKQVNDTLGHEAGDALLRDVGKRLKSCVRQNDIVARLGGDEFVVLLENVSEAQQAAGVAQKIMPRIAGTSQQFGTSGGVTASIGISLYPQDGEDERTLMKNADGAMYRVKQRAKNDFAFHS
jgi:diguanylate cyclase (GGDEF)-like protein/PAS domain S-box-containing protein